MTISPAKFFSVLADEGIGFFTGVPDSLLKEFCSFVDGVLPPEAHVIAANEGSAVGLATGFYLATGRLPMVYLQNSGLGNALNPLLSLADREVYAIPIILLVGWRGMPGTRDEPQHLKQGRVTPALLDVMEIPWRVLDGDEDQANQAAKWASRTAQETSAPVALLVRKDAFGEAEKTRPIPRMAKAKLTRERAISIITSGLTVNDFIVSTTGMISRELYDQRMSQNQDRSKDFLTVGSMGHASQIALGIARARPELRVTCLDGDGAVIMHMGGLASVGASKTGNFLHIVLNNGVHDSVGGQPTVADVTSLTGVASACGYDVVEGPINSAYDLAESVNRLQAVHGRRFLEVLVKPGSRADLGRPKEPPKHSRNIFIARLRSFDSH